MAGISIKYNNVELATSGRARISRDARYETDAPGSKARRAIVNYTLHQLFLQDTFHDNQALYTALRGVLAATPEAQLLIKDESGTTLVDVLARPQTDNLPDQWGQWMLDLTVSFQAVEAISAGVNATASWTGGGGPVTLPNVTAWREAIRTERPTLQVDNRREAVGTIAASGRIVADPTSNEATRRTYLAGQRDAIRGIADHKNITLVFGTFTKLVRVDEVSAEIRDGSYDLEWSLTASYRRFPDATYAEAEYEVSTRDDRERSERILAIRGRVRADNLAGAQTKLDAIIATYNIGSRTLRRNESSVQKIDGTDGATDYHELSFNFELRESLSVVSWRLTVTDRQDAKSGLLITTYSGSVTAQLSSDALAKARDIGATAYPILLNSSESITAFDIGADPEQFAEVTFSYEYARQGTLIYAEVNSQTSHETFGQSTISVGGQCVAASEEAALDLARSFLPDGMILSQRETPQTVQGSNGEDTGTIFTRVDFSYVAFLAQVSGSIEYSEATSKDYSSREITTTYSGTAYGPDESTCNSLIDGIVPMEGRKTRDERTVNRMASEADDVLRSVSFSVSIIAPLPQGDDDILEAEVTLATTYSVDHAVITPIPFGVPFVQEACGITPGMKQVSGQCVAITEATAIAWARGKRSLAISGGYEDPPEERSTSTFFPFSGTSVKAYRFAFNYTGRFANLALS